MTTLLAVYSGRDVVGRCDAKCYEAEHPDCHCVCAGENHSAGLEAAIDNTQRKSGEWLARARENGWVFDGHELGQPIVQLDLFDLEEA